MIAAGDWTKIGGNCQQNQCDTGYSPDSGGQVLEEYGDTAGMEPKKIEPPLCDFTEGTRNTLEEQVEDLSLLPAENGEKERQWNPDPVLVRPSHGEDTYCEYGYKETPLGEYRYPSSYVRLNGEIFSEARYIFFPQTEPEIDDLKPELQNIVLANDNIAQGRIHPMQRFRYRVAVETRSRNLGYDWGNSITRTINEHLTEEYQSDIRGITYRILEETGTNGSTFPKIFEVDIVGFDLPVAQKNVGRPPLIFKYCPEYSWHTLEAKGDVSVPGWEVRCLEEGNLEAVPREEVQRETGDRLGKINAYKADLKNKLIATGYFNSMNPVRRLIDIHHEGWGAKGLECPLFTVNVFEMENPRRDCLVWKLNQTPQEAGAEIIPGGYLLADTPRRSFHVLGNAGKLAAGALQTYFENRFRSGDFVAHAQVSENFNNGECAEWLINVQYERKPIPPDKEKGFAGSEGGAIINPPEPPRQPGTPENNSPDNPLKARKHPTDSSLPEDKKGETLKKMAEATGGGYKETFTPEEVVSRIEEAIPLKQKATHYQILFLVDISGSMANNIEATKKKMDDLMKLAIVQLQPGGQVSFAVSYYVDTIFEEPVILDSSDTLENRKGMVSETSPARSLRPEDESFGGFLFRDMVQKPLKEAATTTSKDFGKKEVEDARKGLSEAVSNIQGTTEYTFDVAERSANNNWAPKGTDVARLMIALTDEKGDISERKVNGEKLTEESVTRVLLEKGIRFEVIRDLDFDKHFGNNAQTKKKGSMNLSTAMEAMKYPKGILMGLKFDEEQRIEALGVITKAAAKNKGFYAKILHKGLQKETSVNVQTEYVLRLRELGFKKAAQTIIPFADREKTTDAKLRIEASRALKEFGDKKAIGVLEKALHDPEKMVCLNAAGGLRKMGRTVPPDACK